MNYMQATIHNNLYMHVLFLALIHGTCLIKVLYFIVMCYTVKWTPGREGELFIHHLLLSF